MIKTTTIAFFALTLCACKLAVIPGSGGVIVSSTGSYDCATPRCEFNVDADFEETFTAVPDERYVFVGWDGGWACVGKRECTVRIPSIPEEYLVPGLGVSLEAVFAKPHGKPNVASVWPPVISVGETVSVYGDNLLLGGLSITLNNEEVIPSVFTENKFQFVAPDLPAGKHPLDFNDQTVSGLATSSRHLTYQNQLIAIAVNAGESSTCAVLDTGKVACWGGGFLNGPKGAMIDGISDATIVKSGIGHRCALIKGGQVQCWGSNVNGQLGTGTASLPPSPFDERNDDPVIVHEIDNAVSISLGHSHSCALVATGEVLCWGAWNQNGSTLNRESYGPVKVDGIDNALAISAGSDHTCAVIDTGEVLCWGENRYGQLGVIDDSSPKWQRKSQSPVLVNGIANAKAIAASSSHSCALQFTGEVMCWGYNGVGQLGNGSRVDSVTPVAVVGISDAIALSAGGDTKGNSCALLKSGIVKCWGNNDNGWVGDGTTKDRLFAVQVKGLSAVNAIATGGGHSCALLDSGLVQCWGSDLYGQLGDMGTESTITITDINDAIKISGSSNHSCALLSSGEVRCWGINRTGELGDGSDTDSESPVRAMLIDQAIDVSAGEGHSCAIIKSGEVQCWGWNYYGQLGDGGTTESHVPQTVNGVSNAVEISVNLGQSCVRLDSGEVVCWGATQGDTQPAALAGINDATSVSVGRQNACVLHESGEVSCFGHNSSGVLGNTDTDYSDDPIKISDVTGAVDVSAGDGHTCAAIETGKVKCWGSNIFGQLGDGSDSSSSSAVTVLGVDNATEVSVGAWYSCALLETGEVRCWGQGKFGNLTLGDDNHYREGLIDSAEPAAAIGISNARAISSNCALTSTGFVRCWGPELPLREILPDVNTVIRPPLKLPQLNSLDG